MLLLPNTAYCLLFVSTTIRDDSSNIFFFALSVSAGVSWMELFLVLVARIVLTKSFFLGLMADWV